MDEAVPGTARTTTVSELEQLDYGWIIRLPRSKPLPEEPVTPGVVIRNVRQPSRVFSGELLEVRKIRAFKGNMPIDEYVLKVRYVRPNKWGEREVHSSEHLSGDTTVEVQRRYENRPRQNRFIPVPPSDQT